MFRYVLGIPLLVLRPSRDYPSLGFARGVAMATCCHSPLVVTKKGLVASWSGTNLEENPWGCLVGLQMDNFPTSAQHSAPQTPVAAQGNGQGEAVEGTISALCSTGDL